MGLHSCNEACAVFVARCSRESRSWILSDKLSTRYRRISRNIISQHRMRQIATPSCFILRPVLKTARKRLNVTEMAGLQLSYARHPVAWNRGRS